MLVEFLILLVSGLLSLYLYSARNHNHWKSKNVQYFQPLPFFGNMLDNIMLRKTVGEVLCDIYNKSVEPFVGFFIFGQPYLLIRDPKIVKAILVNDFHHFSDRTVTIKESDDPISSQMLFFLKNPDWKEIRTKINPVFTPTKIKFMSKLIENSANDLVDYLQNVITLDDEIDVKSLSAKFTIDTIVSSVYGIDVQSLTDEKSQFWVHAKKVVDWSDPTISLRILCYVNAPVIARFFGIRFLHPGPVTFLKNVFEKIIKQRKTNNIVRNDLIDIVIRLQNDENFTLDGDKLFSQTIQFFVAGFDTTSATISFTLYELAKSLDVQTKLREEIRDVAEGHNGINYESVKEMSYLDMCIKETLRKYPALPLLDRRCETDYKIPGSNVVIDKETPIMISLLGLQYDPQYFPEPEKYIPERFSKDSQQDRNFSYLPFGEGPRNCIGMRFGLLNVKLAIANIIKKFEVRMSEATSKEIKFDPKGITLSSTGDLKLKFAKI